MSRTPTFEVIRAETWLEAVLVAGRLAGHVFRGQADASWELSTTLERACNRNAFPKTFLKNREDVILHEFQRRAHHFVQSPPALDDRTEWLALIQHHGGPTRLLDFTASFYVAAFFALEAATNDAAVWGIDLLTTHGHIDWPWQAHETILDRNRKSRDVIEQRLRDGKRDKLVMGFEPFRLNERIAAQRGMFVMPGDIDYTFTENLLETIDCSARKFKRLESRVSPASRIIRRIKDGDCVDSPLVKVVLPLEMHNAAMAQLRDMTIDSASLFPGLDGFARSLAYLLRDVE